MTTDSVDIKRNDKSDFEILISPVESCQSGNSDQSEVSEKRHDVFVIQEEGPDFRGVSWIGAAVLIAKAQFGLGVLGVPATFSALGFVPGMITLVGLCALSTWAGHVVGKFRIRHPLVYSIGDAAEVMFGRAGKEFVGAAFWLYYSLVYSAALLTMSIAFNTLSGHSMCTTLWILVGAVIAFSIGITVRTMKVMAWLGYVGLGTVFISAWIVAIACLAQSRPAAVPAGEKVNKQIYAFITGKPFSSISSAIGVQLLSLCGTAGFFNIHAEMRDQKQYNKSLLVGQGFVIINYIVISCLIYGKVGIYVTSPALGSAGPLFKKICYGIALPGLIFTAFFHAHLAAKYGLVRLLRNTRHLQANTLVHWATWGAMMTIVAVLGFVIAGAIPFFDDLLSLVASLIGSSFVLIIPGLMALHQISGHEKINGEKRLAWIHSLKSNWATSRNNKFTVGIALIAIAFGVFLLGAGTYGAVQSIVDNYQNGSVSSAFSCADNSG